ncbi:MAG TPA: hypothetical protein VLX29_06435 [Nitrospirota bacterium]|nr:hypothetical protein [Nitrospirota bacterium]
MATSLYSTIEEKGFENGIAFIMTPNTSVIEAHIYGGIIIYFKSLRLSFEQICGVFMSGDIKEITFRRAEVKPEIVQPQVVAQTFPGAISASALDPARTPIPKLLRIVHLLSCLVQPDKDEGMKAFDIMCRQISMLYSGFLPDVATIKERMGRAGDEFGIPTALLSSKSLPTDVYSVPKWVFNNLQALAEGPMKDVTLYFIFFGETSNRVIKTVIGKETSLGAKQGYAILSRAVYPKFQGNQSVTIFRGIEKAGDIKIDWHTDKKSAMLLTKADMEKFGLKNDERVNLLFND